METEQKIDEQTRRKGKSCIRNRKEEVGSKQQDGIDVNLKGEEVVEAQQVGIGGERRKGKPVIGNRNEAKVSDSDVEREVERLYTSFAIATGKKALLEMEMGKEKVGKAEPKNQPTIKEKEEELVGQATELQTMKETPPQDTKSAAAAAKEQLRAAKIKKDLKSGPKFDQSDPMAVQADVSRRNWIRIFTGKFGSYEDITSIPPMIYTDKKLEPGYSPIRPMETLQIFSVKIVETSQSLTWPLDVFGMVVARDASDYNRNIIFHRTRDNCQSISTENPYLELTGPSRAVVAFGSVDLEVLLQVKRGGQAKDKCISYLVVSYDGPSMMESCVLKRVRPSKLSTVELTFGRIFRSVEATISVQVVGGGSWPDGFRGEFTASTISLDDMKIQLLAFGDGKLPVAADGMVKLSRRVVSVELKGELRVSLRAVGVGDQAAEKWDTKVFGAQKASRSKAYLEVGSCKVKVTVAWSLLSNRQYPGGWSPE